MIALVLAAGGGRRMGVPKARLAWDGGTLLAAHCDAALGAGCGRVVAVVRAHIASDFPDGSLPRGASLVVSTAPDALGPAGSIAAFVGAHAADLGDTLVAITPVDVVPRAWGSVATLAAALDADPRAVAARPSFANRRGHPVLVRAATLVAHYGPGAATPVRPLRDVFAACGDAVRDVCVDDDAVLADLDTPDDVARWR